MTMVHGKQDTIMSFIPFTMNKIYTKWSNRKTEVAGTPL